MGTAGEILRGASAGVAAPVPVAVRNATGRAPLLLTCEHASAAIPAPYAHLGLTADDVLDHIEIEINNALLRHEQGARELARRLVEAVRALMAERDRTCVSY